VTALVIAAISIIAVLSSAVLLAPSYDTVTIAVILPVDEGSFSHSEEIESAMTMAIDELNKWGGIGNVRIELAVEETLFESEAVSTLFERLERERSPVAYVTVSCGLLSALSPLAEAASVPLIGMASAPGLTEGFEWVYRYYTTVESEVDSTMRMLQPLDVSSLGILYTASSHGCGINELLVEEFSTVGGTVYSEGCGPEETDFTVAVANLSHAEAIYIVSSCNVIMEMLSAVHDSGYAGHVLMASNGASPDMTGLIDAEVVYVSAPAFYRLENMLASTFIERYESVHDAPLDHHGAIAYDLVYLVHGLLEGCEVSREVLGYHLSQGFVFSGVVGNLRIDPGVHDFELPVYPAMVSEGELSYL
jgi:ABC-type branched-subunit amino acid transport system substrate-binding protein